MKTSRLWKLVTTEKKSPMKIFTPEIYSAMKYIHPWKIFTPQKYSPLKNIHHWIIFTRRDGIEKMHSRLPGMGIRSWDSLEWTGTGIPTHSCCSRHPPFQICKMLKYNVEILKHTQGAGYVAHKSSLIWLFSDLIECDGKKTKPASLTASPAVMVATGSPSTLIASPSTPMALFPPPGMDGVPQPTVSTKELIIIIFMFCLWAYSLFLTYRLSIWWETFP